MVIANFENISRVEHTQEAFAQAFRDNLYYTRGQAIYTATRHDLYEALALTVRDYMMYNWQQNVDCYFRQNPKFVYYLSAEYLVGQQLEQNLLYTNTYDLARQTMQKHDIDLAELIALDIEPGLGNGGLGRLSACFMDSLATLNIPAVGYGIRYEYGIFRQSFRDGWQVESPDEWLYYGNPWEFPSRMIWSRSASAGGPSTIPTVRAPTASAGFRRRPSWASPITRWCRVTEPRP